MSALALMPAAAQPATEVASLKQAAAPEPSNSTLDIPIEEIAASPGGCAILDKDFPGLRTHPMYGFAKVMTLNQITAMSHGEITRTCLRRRKPICPRSPSSRSPVSNKRTPWIWTPCQPAAKRRSAPATQNRRTTNAHLPLPYAGRSASVASRVGASRRVIALRKPGRFPPPWRRSRLHETGATLPSSARIEAREVERMARLLASCSR